MLDVDDSILLLVRTVDQNIHGRQQMFKVVGLRGKTVFTQVLGRKRGFDSLHPLVVKVEL